jgi:hypothetical protein
MERCRELVRDLLYTRIAAWDGFFSTYWGWCERVESHIYDREQDIPEDKKFILIKRLQLLEAELKVAYSLVTSITPPPSIVPLVIQKDMRNIEATFWPPFRIDRPGDPKPQLTIDYEDTQPIFGYP